MADVILIQPGNGLYRKSQIYIPTGLLFVSSFLNKEGYDIKIIDMRIEDNWEEVLLRELKTSPICVGITVMTGIPILDGLKVSKLVKKYNKDIPVVWGGVHPSILPKQTIENENIDFVIQGEGEYTFYELVKALENGKTDSYNDIKGLWYKENSKPKSTSACEFLNLDELPDLPYNLIDVGKYIKTTKYYFEDGMFTLQTSRGCPYKCTFCYNSNFNRSKWRAMSPERVLEQIKCAVNNYKIKGIGIIDDNFFMNIKRADTILELIERAGIDIKLHFQGMTVESLHRMNKSQLQRLERLGVEYLQLGVESGSQRILDLINKRIRVEQIIDINKKLNEYTNIKPIYNFMIGFPTETEDDIFLTTQLFIKLMEENHKAVLQNISVLVPYPGTTIYDLALRLGLKPPSTLEEWGSEHWIYFDKRYPWLSKKMNNMIKRVVYASFGANKNLSEYFDSRFKRLLFKSYHPLAKFRLKHNFYYFMPEASTNLVEKLTKVMLTTDTS
ncbi:MAG: B12-binding domain-containing radical SAM protein [Nitrospinae bacterium]|nr:B12-binding domain-containing radical SAM protein [Nitrospinota bacterium]